MGGARQEASLLEEVSLQSPSIHFSPWTFPPQKYNADYDLSARQGADTLAFMSLLEEKLLPVLVSAQAYIETHRHTHTPSMGTRIPPWVRQVQWLRPASSFLHTQCRYILFG